MFEAVGLSEDLSRAYFGGTTTAIGGIGLDEIAEDSAALHHEAFGNDIDDILPNKGIYSYRKDGEQHAWNPETISTLQLATRLGSYKKFKEYSKIVDEKEEPNLLLWRTGYLFVLLSSRWLQVVLV